MRHAGIHADVYHKRDLCNIYVVREKSSQGVVPTAVMLFARSKEKKVNNPFNVHR